MESTHLILIYKMSIGVVAVRLIIFVENPLLKNFFDEKPVFWASLDGGKIFLFQNFFSVLLIWYLATSKLLSVFFGHKKSTGLVVSPSTPVQITIKLIFSLFYTGFLANRCRGTTWCCSFWANNIISYWNSSFKGQKMAKILLFADFVQKISLDVDFPAFLWQKWTLRVRLGPLRSIAKFLIDRNTEFQ